MNLYFLTIVALIILGSKVYFKDFNKSYLSKDSTSCVKGIFILIVIFQHMKVFLKLSHAKNFLMIESAKWLGQLMVTLFLFYSGYGVYESIKKKKQKYVNSIPKNRCLKTWLHFAFAVTLFLLMSFVVEKDYPIKTIFLSYVAWGAIGNSNWYIFGIIFLYFITYLSFKLFDKNDKHAIRMTFLLTFILTLCLSMHRPDYCYNTLWCYPFGMIYSYYKDKIEKVILHDNKKYFISMFLALTSVLILKEYAIKGFMYYELLSIAFCILVVGITMKFNISNPILKWFGDNLFWVYILQRLPMIYLNYIGYNIHPYRYGLIVVVVTIILTSICSYIIPKIDRKIFKEKTS